MVGLMLMGCHVAAVPGPVPPSFDVERVRRLARDAGALPDSIRFVEAARGATPLWAATAAGPLTGVDFVFGTVEIRWPGGHSIAVDAMADQEATRSAIPWLTIPDTGWAAQERVLGQADAIYITHEHFDHLGGLVTSQNWASHLAKTHLTEAQHANLRELMRSGMTTAQHASLTPLSISAPWAVDGGVVLIPSPGHTEGHLWVYVMDAAGEEWLLAGDSCWDHDAVTSGVGKARPLSAAVGEDAAIVARQLAELRGLEGLGWHVLCAHDAEDMAGAGVPDKG